MCFAHVINIACQHVIDEMTDNKHPDMNTDDSDSELSTDSLVTHQRERERHPIALGRAIVQALRSSGKRRDDFDDLISNGNAKGWFQVGDPPIIVRVPPLQLLRDVKTRWDSVYYMIRRLLELRPVSSSCDL